MSFMGNSFVGFREPECNSPERLGARLHGHRLAPGSQRWRRSSHQASAVTRQLPTRGVRARVSGPRAERRGPGAAYLRLRPACVLPARDASGEPAAGRLRVGACLGSADQRQRAGHRPAPHPPTCASGRGGRAATVFTEGGGAGRVRRPGEPRAGQGRLAGAGRHRVLPSGGGAPGGRVHCGPPPPRPGLANSAASPRVTVRAWNPGKMGSAAASWARSPRRVGATSWGSPGCRNCRPRSRRREGSQILPG